MWHGLLLDFNLLLESLKRLFMVIDDPLKLISLSLGDPDCLLKLSNLRLIVLKLLIYEILMLFLGICFHCIVRVCGRLFFYTQTARDW